MRVPSARARIPSATPRRSASEAGAASDLSLHDLPWYRPPEWQPKYSGLHNDLPALVHHQLAASSAPSGLLALVTISRLEPGSDTWPLFFNFLAALLLLGQQRSYVVACVSEAALQSCLGQRLPCANMTQHEHRRFNGTSAPWVKVFSAADVLGVMPDNATLLVTDYDVIYLKPVEPAAARFFETTAPHADATAMTEEVLAFDTEGKLGPTALFWIMNTGVMLLRNGPRVRRMYELWARAASYDMHDQAGLSRLHLSAFALCSTDFMCRVHAMNNMAAVVRHNWPDYYTPAQTPLVPAPQCAPCTVHLDEPGPNGCDYVRTHCSVQARLYVHAICFVGDRLKIHVLRLMGLWFLASTPRAAHSTGGGGGGGSWGAAGGWGVAGGWGGGGAASHVGRGGAGAAAPRVNVAAIEAAGLPCPPGENLAVLRHEP
ncbi:hypothetical protein HYH03_015492 [Edaphochlamys debaryana]|uniref:Nucleotide-diphospho-sugar transferase domain-containing protein n=1 Tax=Edaphochlamys debaryana TaxID=47281 RepID=A0A835XRS8_9CHLO|nr:hypothetical protein HYH03_015492 [Edaphochlamys debaryana]|eukprot:KAG2485780.1 hypothetical protein HYH03_015492 [Edaphochlamys debaryana]